MSSFLKHIEFVKSVGSEIILLNVNKFHLGISDELIDFKIKKFLNEKIELFHRKLKYDAPFEDIVWYLCDYSFLESNLDIGACCEYKENKIIRPT